jgi:Tat protein secretion system quality control protein TatD with DNase activity
MRTAVQIPLERLLLETDAPDGRPRLGDVWGTYQEQLLNFQSQDGTEDQELNHPANIRQAAVTVCQQLQLPGHSKVVQQLSV